MSSIHYLLVVFGLFSSLFPTFQDSLWKSYTKDGVEIKSLVDKKEINGTEQTVGRYVAIKEANISLEEAEKLIRDGSGAERYVEFTTSSKILNRTNPNAWTVHMYFDAPYPLGDSDCVLNYTLVRTTDGFVVNSTCNPEGYERGKVDRMEYSEGKFEFEKISENRTRITMSSSFAPAGNPPKWMLAAWFPKGPAKMMNRFVEAADSYSE